MGDKRLRGVWVRERTAGHGGQKAQWGSQPVIQPASQRAEDWGGQRPTKGVPGRVQPRATRLRLRIRLCNQAPDQQLIRMSASGCPPSPPGPGTPRCTVPGSCPSRSPSLPAAATSPHTFFFFGPRGVAFAKPWHHASSAGSGCSGCGWPEGTFRNEIIIFFFCSFTKPRYPKNKTNKKKTLMYAMFFFLHFHARKSHAAFGPAALCMPQQSQPRAQPASQPAPRENE